MLRKDELRRFLIFVKTSQKKVRQNWGKRKSHSLSYSYPSFFPWLWGKLAATSSPHHSLVLPPPLRFLFPAPSNFGNAMFFPFLCNFQNTVEPVCIRKRNEIRYSRIVWLCSKTRKLTRLTSWTYLELHFLVICYRQYFLLIFLTGANFSICPVILIKFLFAKCIENFQGHADAGFNWHCTFYFVFCLKVGLRKLNELVSASGFHFLN